MKKMLALLVALCTLNNANAQWTFQITDTINSLNSVFFTDVNKGIAVGNNGIIIKTINGGQTWTSINSGSIHDFSSICFTSADTGYIAGSDGIGYAVVLKTINGGLTWNNSLSITDNYSWLISVCHTDNNTLYAVGCNGTILKSSNAGVLWNPLNSGSIRSLTSVFFTGNNIGYVVGEWGTILKTINSGLNWISLNSGTTKNLNSVYFTDVNTGYAVGENGMILKTTDGGINWISSASGTTQDLNSIFFTDYNTAYTVGDLGVILKTTDGGNTWVNQNANTINYLRSVFFVNPNIGYIVGGYQWFWGNIILKTINGGAIGVAEINNAKHEVLIYPNPAADKLMINLYNIKDLNNGIISIYDLQGKLLLQQSINQPNTEFDIKSLFRGVYLIKVCDDNYSIVSKFLKE